MLFQLDLALALHAYGTPAHRLEEMLHAVGERIGLPLHVVAIPTAIFAASGELATQRTYLVAANQGEVDLGRLSELDEVAQEVATGAIDATRGSQRVQRLMAAPGRYLWWVRWMAHAVLCASAAFLMGGGFHEAGCALALGALIGLLDLWAKHSQSVARLLLPLGAFVGAAGAVVATRIFPSLSTQTVGIAAIVLLMPGLTLTVAMTEVATGHLVSGTARLSKAMVSFLLLGFGAAVGGQLAASFLDVSAGALASGVGPTRWIGLALSLPTLTILLAAKPRDMGWLGIAAVIAYAGGLLGAAATGPAVGAAIATTLLGLAGNAFARFVHRPAVLVIVPGILLLVPGSLGFRSVSSFVNADILHAVETAFDVALVAVGLVAGLLVANLALPPRKAL